MTRPDRVDYAKLYKNRYSLLEAAYRNSDIKKDSDYKKFCAENDWLEDYALFMALKDAHHGAPWSEWEPRIKRRSADAIEQNKEELSDRMDFHRFLQYHFDRQWKKLRAYAGENGIQIIGDLPIYVALDSADTWSHPELFQFDRSRLPRAVAGCPPDGFSEDGQLWGNPLYNWKKHRSTGFAWWISRLEYSFKRYDVLRIDHFRGFDEYYSIPLGDKNARGGHWEKGPGIRLFRAAEKALGHREVIAEDLGFMTDSVRRLVKATGYPNMKVLQFAFDARDTSGKSDHMPHNYKKNCVAYTGTHDNQTITAWFHTISENERQMVREYLCDFSTPDDRISRGLIALILRSRAKLCIIPMQDWLGLDDESRMNTPSSIGENWKWRMKKSDFDDKLCEEIRAMTRIYSREPT